DAHLLELVRISVELDHGHAAAPGDRAGEHAVADDRIDAAGEVGDDRAGVGGVGRFGEHDVPAAGRADAHHGGAELGEVGVGEVVDDEAEGDRPLLDEPAPEAGGTVV